MPSVVILTSTECGTAGHHLPFLVERSKAEIRLVVLSEGRPLDRTKVLRTKLRKARSIGLLGTVNGVRMRRWYGRDLQRYVRIEPLSVLCERYGIPLVRVPHTNGDDTVAAFRRADADLGLSLGNSYIASKVFEIPRQGMLNIHAAILPDYQNAQSILWELYNGSRETGYTIHRIDKGIDTGAIVLRERFPLELRPTLGDTVTWNVVRGLALSARGLVRVLGDVDGYLARAEVQRGGTKYTTPSLRECLVMRRNWRRMLRGDGSST
ncbi:MAG TPA: formyltransferase family protein [Gaiellaceae bacterium]|nr:formyltransferase family protein [Gaiellaceae bacterium]